MPLLPPHVKDLDWGEGLPEFSEGESRELELLREIYEGEDLEERESALDTGCQWFNTLAAPTPQWIRALLPLLSHETDPLVPSVLMYLSLYADALVPQRDGQEDVELALNVIRSGYEMYLKLFNQAPVDVAGLLTASPEKAPEYLPLLLSLYESESDLLRKAGLIHTLAKVATDIPNWRERLLEGIRGAEDSALVFVCASEMAVLDGDDTPAEILEAIVRTSIHDDALRLFRRCMVRMLPRLSRGRRIPFLIDLLAKAEDSATSESITKYLLEAAYGEIGVVDDVPELHAYNGVIEKRYEWVGPPRTRDVPLPTRGESDDWLGAIASKEALRRDINPYRPPGDLGPTNLYRLFGLPDEHQGLVALWEGRKE